MVSQSERSIGDRWSGPAQWNMEQADNMFGLCRTIAVAEFVVSCIELHHQ